MAFNIFGFTLDKKEKQGNNTVPMGTEDSKKSFVPKTEDESSIIIESGAGAAAWATFVDLDGTAKTDRLQIEKYRSLAFHPEVDGAIEDIVNEAIVIEEADPVSLSLDDLKYSDKIKKRIQEEFTEILSLLNFKNRGHDIFRSYYIDGRIMYHMVIDEQKRKEGIQELRWVDPKNLRKVKEVKRKLIGANIESMETVDEYYVYYEDLTEQNTYRPNKVTTSVQGLKITKDCIAQTNSGWMDSTKTRTFSFLQKAIKPLNQLRMMEDAAVIYKIARAPSRRVFYVDVGSLPKNKAEQYLNAIMNKYKNKLVYNAQTGEVADDKAHLSMLEDFWLPRREGGKGTEIGTIDGMTNQESTEQLQFFQKKLFLSLNVPFSRFQGDQTFSLGRSSEITRDELKFSKFISRLRNRFTALFDDLLKTQLILKEVISEEDWEEIKEAIRYEFAQDNHFAELKNSEIMTNRMQMLAMVDPYVGKYFSMEWVRRKVLMQTDEEIKEIDKQIKKEAQLYMNSMAVAGEDQAQPVEEAPQEENAEQSAATQKEWLSKGKSGGKSKESKKK